MSSQKVDSGNGIRENAVDVLLFVVAVVLSVYAIVEIGPYGLAVGSVLLSVAAALVVGRQEGTTPAEDARSEDALASDGGRRGD
jgi:hypothetical protein